MQIIASAVESVRAWSHFLDQISFAKRHKLWARNATSLELLFLALLSSFPMPSWGLCPHMDHTTLLWFFCCCFFFFFFFAWPNNSQWKSNNSNTRTWQHEASKEHLKSWAGQVFKSSRKAKRKVLGQCLSYKGKEGANVSSRKGILWYTDSSGRYLLF